MEFSTPGIILYDFFNLQIVSSRFFHTVGIIE